MILDSNKTKYSIIIILMFVMITGTSLIIRQELDDVERSIAEQIHDRENKVKEKMQLIESFILTMGKNMEQNIAQQIYTQSFHPALNKLKNYPEYGLNAIDEAVPTGRFSINGTLEVIGYKEDVNNEIKHEISAALNLKSVFYSAISNVKELKWAYFISVNQFMYSVPHSSIKDTQFSSDYYAKNYWLKAQPDLNIDRQLVITKVYQDFAGKGDLVTFSLPVYFEDEFLGIIGLDIVMQGFTKILSQPPIQGDLLLLDEDDSILSSNTAMKVGTIVYRPMEGILENIIHHDEDGYDYLTFQIVEKELFIIHRYKRNEKYLLAFNNSFREIILLLFVVVMSYLIYSYRQLINKVGILANIDPLTGLLNRRAMENSVLPLLSVSDRYEQKMCFLIADIDYFKNINDTYGHVVGDDVLKSITTVLNSCLRNSDLLSRHGGEEFLIVLPQTEIESGRLLAERIRTSVENTRTGENSVAVTISVGCIERTKEESYDAAITRADMMLYKAKSTGRNKTVTESE